MFIKKILLFLSFSLYISSQNNDEITNAIQIFCGDNITSSTVNNNSDQEYLTSV